MLTSENPTMIINETKTLVTYASARPSIKAVDVEVINRKCTTMRKFLVYADRVVHYKTISKYAVNPDAELSESVIKAARALL